MLATGNVSLCDCLPYAAVGSTWCQVLLDCILLRLDVFSTAPRYVLLLQDALYVDVSNKRVRTYQDRGGAGGLLQDGVTDGCGRQQQQNGRTADMLHDEDVCRLLLPLCMPHRAAQPLSTPTAKRGLQTTGGPPAVSRSSYAHFSFTCRSMPVHRPAGTSLENNNVFTVQPTVYFEGMDPATESASMYQDVDLMPSGPLNPATVTVGIVALGIVAVAGSATAIYYEVRLVLVQQHCWLFGCSCLRIWLECFDCSAPQAVVLL